MAKKKQNGGDADAQQNSYPKVGEESVTTEGSHRSISNGDGTARQVPIVNTNGEYPPRPADEE